MIVQKVYGKRVGGGPSRGPALGYFSLVTPGEATPDVPAALQAQGHPLNYTVLEYNENGDNKAGQDYT